MALKYLDGSTHIQQNEVIAAISCSLQVGMTKKEDGLSSN